MKLTIEKNFAENFEEATKYEWLETNGLGGYASSTICGCNTRRYHGLLVGATHPPTERMVLVSKLDETILMGEEKFELGCNNYGDAIAPHGYQFLEKFSRGLFPEFIYRAGDIRIKKTIAMVHGENTTVIIYEVLHAPTEFTFELLPLIAVRSYHDLEHANEEVNKEFDFENGTLRITAYDDTPEIFMDVPGASFIAQPNWYNHFEYSEEKARGLDDREDLFTHGSFSTVMREGQTLGIILSTQNTSEKDALKLLKKEKSRRQALLKLLPQHDLVSTLALAADQFIVQRDEDLKTIIAGYHWFTDWSRDTMIALNGLCLSTHRLEDAKKILAAFSQNVSMGMLPNRFRDSGLEPEYNNVDGTLWYFIAVYHYLDAGGDKKFVVKEILPVLTEIIDWHFKGTRYQIHVDEDGLLFAGEDGIQLTWMDAKVGDWVVTPRIGKAVEINALWYNALCIYAQLLQMNKEKEQAKTFRTKAKAVKQKFIETFWNEELKYLYDVVNVEEKDPSLRPNQLFAIGLPFALVEDEKAQSILHIVKEKLYTPAGLRSLSPDDAAYKGTYLGDHLQRDGAYHQGTVWSWLLGMYIDTLIKVDEKGARKEAVQVVADFMYHLEEAGIGTISEIFDGDAPFHPQGCIAQAWSVGELLRVTLQYRLYKKIGIKADKKQKRKARSGESDESSATNL
jgi:predicted glycogen debranching enzyme